MENERKPTCCNNPRLITFEDTLLCLECGETIVVGGMPRDDRRYELARDLFLILAKETAIPAVASLHDIRSRDEQEAEKLEKQQASRIAEIATTWTDALLEAFEKKP